MALPAKSSENTSKSFPFPITNSSRQTHQKTSKPNISTFQSPLFVAKKHLLDFLAPHNVIVSLKHTSPCDSATRPNHESMPSSPPSFLQTCYHSTTCQVEGIRKKSKGFWSGKTQRLLHRFGGLKIIENQEIFPIAMKVFKKTNSKIVDKLTATFLLRVHDFTCDPKVWGSSYLPKRPLAKTCRTCNKPFIFELFRPEDPKIISMIITGWMLE